MSLFRQNCMHIYMQCLAKYENTPTLCVYVCAQLPFISMLSRTGFGVVCYCHRQKYYNKYGCGCSIKPGNSPYHGNLKFWCRPGNKIPFTLLERAPKNSRKVKFDTLTKSLKIDSKDVSFHETCENFIDVLYGNMRARFGHLHTNVCKKSRI